MADDLLFSSALMVNLDPSEEMQSRRAITTSAAISTELQNHRNSLHINGTSISAHSHQIHSLEKNLENVQNGVSTLDTRLATVESSHQQLDSHIQTNRRNQEESKATLTRVVEDINLMRGKYA